MSSSRAQTLNVVNFEQLHRCVCSLIFFSSPNLIVFPQVAAASLPSTVTVRPTTPGQIVGTWWRLCPPGGHGWVWPPSATDCMPWEGEWREPQYWLRILLIWQLISHSDMVSWDTSLNSTRKRSNFGSFWRKKNLFYQSNVLMHINSGMMAHRTSQQLSLTTPSLTPGSQRFPWEHGAAVWV